MRLYLVRVTPNHSRGVPMLGSSVTYFFMFVFKHHQSYMLINQAFIVRQNLKVYLTCPNCI